PLHHLHSFPTRRSSDLSSPYPDSSGRPALGLPAVPTLAQHGTRDRERRRPGTFSNVRARAPKVRAPTGRKRRLRRFPPQFGQCMLHPPLPLQSFLPAQSCLPATAHPPLPL